MTRVIFLGTGAALPSENQDSASLLFQGSETCLLVDSSGNTYRKLLYLSIDRDKLEHILITHNHLDHIGGLPALLECLRIEGRKKPVHIYALKEVTTVIETLLDLWELRNGLERDFPIEIHPLEGLSNEQVLQTTDFTVNITPVKHSIPNIAVKVTTSNHKSFVYTSDTGYYPPLVEFARGADYLAMECTFGAEKAALSEKTGHLDTSTFPKMAQEIGARVTIMVHHSYTGDSTREQVRAELSRAMGGAANAVLMPEDLDYIDLV